MKCCVIIGALVQDIHVNGQDYVIAADGGHLVAEKQGIVPDLVIGDWDSSEKPEGCKVIELPHEKDDTDTHFAARWAVEHGFQCVRIYGGIGGRLDHTLSNLQTLYYLEKQKIQATLYGQGAEAHILTEEQKKIVIPDRKGWYLSVFAFGGEAAGVSIKNAYYSVENGTMKPELPIGVSNEFTGEDVEISVQKGNLLILLIKK